MIDEAEQWALLWMVLENLGTYLNLGTYCIGARRSAKRRAVIVVAVETCVQRPTGIPLTL